MRACRRHGFADTLALVAEDDGDARELGQPLGHQLAVWMRPHERHLGLAGPGQQGRRSGVARDVEPVLRPASHGARHGERRPRAFDDVEPLHAERLARPQHGRSVVRIVRPVEDHGDARQAPANHLEQARAPRFTDQRLQHPHDPRRVVRLRPCDAPVHQLFGADNARGGATHERSSGYSSAPACDPCSLSSRR